MQYPRVLHFDETKHVFLKPPTSSSFCWFEVSPGKSEKSGKQTEIRYYVGPDQFESGPWLSGNRSHASSWSQASPHSATDVASSARPGGRAGPRAAPPFEGDHTGDLQYFFLTPQVKVRLFLLLSIFRSSTGLNVSLEFRSKTIENQLRTVVRESDKVFKCSASVLV